jgi:hypothetical protein
MTTQIFCAAVVGDIGAQKQWGLKVGRGEGIITDANDIVFFCNLANSLDIDHLHSGVRGCFNPNDFGVGLDR